MESRLIRTPARQANDSPNALPVAESVPHQRPSTGKSPLTQAKGPDAVNPRALLFENDGAIEVEGDNQVVPDKAASFCQLFLIFGLNVSKFEQLQQSYEILASHPSLEQEPDLAVEHNYLASLELICFPEQRRVLEPFTLSSQAALCKHRFFHFITTNAVGTHQYLTSLNYKELTLSARGAFIAPKALVMASSTPVFSLHTQFLEMVYQKVCLRHNDVAIRAYRAAHHEIELEAGHG